MKIYSAIYEDYAHVNILFPQATTEVVTKPEELNEEGILIIHGGADISPTIYNQKPTKYTQATEELSKRDKIELSLMKKAIEKGIFIYGICRGAQLACCLAGGSLIQHVINHQYTHTIQTINAKLETNSAHHQMMNLTNTEHKVIAWAPKNYSGVYITDNGAMDIDFEPEIVFFPKIKALAVQGHPEWLLPTSKLVKLCNNLIEEYYVQRT